jgi:KDO2-lipid IV(A) lauroyltransferase
MAVVFMEIQKISRGHYEVTFKLVEERVDAQNEQAVMLRCIKEMEQQICLSPEFWLWTHKRFKHARPDTMKLITI